MSNKFPHNGTGELRGTLGEQFPGDKHAGEGNWNYPLSIEGGVPLVPLTVCGASDERNKGTKGTSDEKVQR